MNAGLIQPEILDNGQVRVDMGKPILNPTDVPSTLASNHDSGAAVAQPLEVEDSTWTVTAVSMGNPHAVVFAKDGGPVVVDDIVLARTGPLFEHNEVFPARVNTEFVEVQRNCDVLNCFIYSPALSGIEIFLFSLGAGSQSCTNVCLGKRCWGNSGMWNWSMCHCRRWSS